MIIHKAPLFAATIDTGNATPESRNKIFHSREQHIGQHRAFEIIPEPFNQVQTRTVRRQLKNFNLIPMFSKPLLPDRLSMMKSPVATDQMNLSPGIDGDQGNQKDKKNIRTFYN
jgi:hypothetical protein